MEQKKSAVLAPYRPYIDRFKHPFVIPVTTFLVLFFLTLAGFIALSGETLGATDTHTVNITIDDQQQVIPTRAKTVRDLLERLDVKPGERDVVEPSLDTRILEDNFHVNVYTARPVTIVDGAQQVTTVGAGPSARKVAEAAGFATFPEDIVERQPQVAEPTDVLREGIVSEKLTIKRATLIKLNLYGVTYDVRTHAKSVRELAETENIDYDQASVFPTLDAPIASEQAVFITEPGKKIEVIEETIAQGEQSVDDYGLQMGRTVVKEAGRAGKKAVVYEIAEDGRRTPLQEVIVVQPVNRVLARGRQSVTVTGNKAEIMAAAGISPSEFAAADAIISRESGWRVNATNAGGCAGLGQACPGSKLAAACPAWQTDAVCQMKYFSGYARGRYGSWTRAYQIWQVQHWW